MSGVGSARPAASRELGSGETVLSLHKRFCLTRSDSVALKRSDLYSSLWQSCDELRGGMDASQYKDYSLTLLFVKYVTDKAKSDPDSLIDIPPGGSFDDMVALKGDKRSATRSTRSSANWPRPTISRRSSTWLTSTTRRSSARVKRCRTGSASW